MAGGENVKLFKSIQNIYQDIGIIPHQSNQNHKSINVRNWFILICQAQFFLSTAAYFLFKADSAIEYGMVFYTCACVLFYFVTYSILIWQVENVLSYIENYERFIEKRIHSTTVYKITIEKMERFTKYFSYAVAVTMISLLLPALLYTIVNYYVLVAGKESFFLCFPTWWPFDWKTPLGYLVAWLGQCAELAVIDRICVSLFNIVFGPCWLIIVTTEDITKDMDAFNITVATQKDTNDRVEWMKRFRDIVQLYSDAKELISDFNQMFKYLLFTFFSWAMLALSSLLITLQFQLWNDNDSKLFEISELSMLILWLFGFNLAVCESGQRVTDQFEQFDLKFGRCEWNKLPLEMQRMYLIFLSDSQRLKNIQSYGGILCTRDTFKQITNKGFSYFMTLRNFRA